MSKAFKALGDETRREILKMLNERDMTAGEISDKFDMARPSISKHLDVLREAELVSSEKKGQYVIYSINTSVLQKSTRWFLDIFSK